MNWFYCSGIILLYFLMVNGGQQDCLVDDVFKKEHWSGEEVKFFTYVSENDVVNIKVTYKFLEETDYFTTFYFSPSKMYSKRIETKYGEELHRFDLETMKNANQWVEFKISSEKGTIEVVYEPNTHEQISINQTSHTFKDLIIRASNISFCNNDREWEVSEGIHQLIPLGRNVMHKTFHLRLFFTHPIKPVIHILNSSKILPASNYSLMIERTNVTLTPLEGLGENIQFFTNQNVTTIDISSHVGSFIVSIYFKNKPKSPKTTTVDPMTNEEDCPTCNNIAYIAILISFSPFVIFSIVIIFIGVTAKLGNFPYSLDLIKSLLNKLNNEGKMSRKEDQFLGNEEQGSGNDIRNGADDNRNNQEGIPLKENPYHNV